MKNKNKIVLILLCLFLVICAVGTAGVLIWRNTEKTTVSENNTFEDGKTVLVSDEAELRELLLADAKLVINVTEDITVDEPFIVNGSKTLSGNKSISMALYVMPYQNLITVTDNASLILDGVTINGNGIANSVKVEKKAELTFLSGSVKLGCPYGMEIQGNADIKGGSITNAIHTGIYVTSSGNVHMESGNVNEAGYCAVKVAKGGYVCLSDDGILQGSNNYHIHNSGTCDVTGGILRDSNYSLVYNDGELNVEYQGNDDGMIEWYNASGSGIYNDSSGVINAKRLYVHDVGYAGINSAQGVGEINLTDCKFENIGNNALHIRSAAANLKNIEIKNAGKHGVFVNSPTTVATIENLLVTETEERGLHNAGGRVTVKNATIISPGTYGVSTGNSGDVTGSVTVENLTVTGAGSKIAQPAVNSYKSVLTINGGVITDSKGVGARVTDGGEIALKNVKIEKTESYGIYVVNSKTKATIENVSVTNTEKHGVYVNGANANAVINKLTITNAGERGFHNAGGTVTAKDVTIILPGLYGVSTGNYTDKETGKSTAGSVMVDNLTVTGAGSKTVQPGVNSYKSVLIVNGGTIIDSKGVGARVTDGGILKLTDVEITNTGDKYEGVYVASKGQASLKNVTVTNAGKHGVYVHHADSRADINALTVASPGERGLHNAGGKITAKNVTITSPGTYGVSTGNSGDSAGSVSVNNLTVTGAKGDSAVNSYNSALYITDAKIKDSAKRGARVTDGGTLGLTDVEIITTGVGYDGVLVNTKGDAVLKNVTVMKAGNHGIYVNGADSKADIGTLTITESAERGLHNAGGTVTGEHVTIISPENYGVSTGNYTDEEGTVTAGSVTIKDLTVTGAKTNPAVNAHQSVLTVNGGKIKDAAKIGARVTGSGTLKLTDVEIENAGTNGVYVAEQGKAVLNAIVITDVGQHGVYVKDSGSKAIAEGLTVTNTGSKYDGIYVELAGEINLNGISNITAAGRHGIYINGKDAKANINMKEGAIAKTDMLTITDVKERAIYNVAGTVMAANVTTNNSGAYGISLGAKDSNRASATIIGLTINGTKANSGVMAHNSDLTVIGGSIKGTKTDGAVAASGGILNLTNVEINDVGRNGVQVEVNSIATVTNVTVTNVKSHGLYTIGGKMTGENITIVSPEVYGVYAVNSGTTKGSVTVMGLSVSGAKGKVVSGSATDGDAAVLANNSELTITGTEEAKAIIRDSVLRGAGVINGGTLNLTNVDIKTTGAGYDGIIVTGSGQANLNNVNVTGAGRHGVRVNIKSTATIDTLTVTDCKERGVYLVGGTAIASNVTMNSTGQYGISLGNSGSTRAKATITGLTINGTRANCGVMAYSSDLTIIGGTITGTKTDGGTAASGGILNLTDVSISDAGRDGVRVETNSTANLTRVTFKNCTGKETNKTANSATLNIH